MKLATGKFGVEFDTIECDFFWITSTRLVKVWSKKEFNFKYLNCLIIIEKFYFLFVVEFQFIG